MKGFLLGMVCGAALTLAITHWRGTSAPERSGTEVLGGERAAPAAIQPEPVRSRNATASDPAPAASSSPAIVEPPPDPVFARDRNITQPLATTGETTFSNAPPELEPGKISPLFADVFKVEPGAVVHPVVQMHRKLDAEPQDTAWAPAMEDTLREFLQQQPGFERIEILVLDCRTAICEIQAAGFRSDADPQLPAHLQIYNIYQAATIAIEKQPWATGLSHHGTTFGSRDERVLFVTHFTRNP